MENIYYFDSKNILYKFVDNRYLLTSTKQNNNIINTYFDYYLCNFDISNNKNIGIVLNNYSLLVNYDNETTILIKNANTNILINLQREIIYSNKNNTKLLSKNYQQDDEFMIVKDQCFYLYSKNIENVKELTLHQDLIIDGITYYLIYKQDKFIHFSDLNIQIYENNYAVKRINYPLYLISYNNKLHTLLEKNLIYIPYIYKEYQQKLYYTTNANYHLLLLVVNDYNFNLTIGEHMFNNTIYNFKLLQKKIKITNQEKNVCLTYQKLNNYMQLQYSKLQNNILQKIVQDLTTCDIQDFIKLLP